MSDDQARALVVERARTLAPLTTLGLGGPASHFAEVDSRALLEEALAVAKREQLAVGILGGGSNLVIADGGFDGLVVRLATRGIELTRERERATLTAQAGESWDDVVSLAVSEGLAGIECLSGIPGSVGATPIQNVGAYGQEVSDVIEAVEVLDRTDDSIGWLDAAECAFGYRDSHFKRDPSRYVVLAVRFVLRSGGAPSLRYGELSRALAQRGASPTLRDVQQTVRSLRASKGMLIEPGWPRSAGSFFMNPVVTLAEAERVQQHALSLGRIAKVADMPRFAMDDGRVKLAAAWLIEQSGIQKGLQRGPVGVSLQHALALVHYGHGSTRDLMALATEIQQQVEGSFGIRMHIEPVRWGV